MLFCKFSRCILFIADNADYVIRCISVKVKMSKPLFRHYLRAFPCYRAMFRFFDAKGSEKERPALYDIYRHYLEKARSCFDAGLDFQPYEVEFSRAIDALGIPHFFDGV